ncbi:membrane protein [Iodidimonas muriae]|uniref:Membrane protein n=1 Tax=Iodidimonas muriae TaxID=261467 RepID=A0ABQ2LBE0_9PROT|nr:MAPEG family protein [Iodidimonas muriae]GER05917.1 membrane protein [Kordiimonadales bacterium JCM 17843]GGO07411.1 membrane protein [Iodidimonas muriae]
MTLAAWCLLAAFLLIYAPRGPLLKSTLTQEGRYDILEPRAQQARLKGKAMRAYGAHLNMVEAFGPFAAAVIMAHILEADPLWRDGLAVTFIAARLLYIPAYLRDWGYGRTAVWAVGLLAVIGLFILPAFH